MGLCCGCDFLFFFKLPLPIGVGPQSFCWKGFWEAFLSFKLCVLFKALCAAVALVSCVAMNNHRYVICTMVVSYFTEGQQTLISKGKQFYSSCDSHVALR